MLEIFIKNLKREKEKEKKYFIVCHSSVIPSFL